MEKRKKEETIRKYKEEEKSINEEKETKVD